MSKFSSCILFKCYPFLLIYLLCPDPAFSQKKIKSPYDPIHKQKRKSIDFLTRHIKRSGAFSDKSEEFFIGLRGYKTSDTLKANKLIGELNDYPDTLISQLLKSRLEWECKQRLQRTMLNSAKLKLKNNIDSAAYFYTCGIYFKDSLYERIARKMGFVRAAADGSEYVDWKKMNKMRWNWWDWHLIKISHPPSFYSFRKEKLVDSVHIALKKAIELDSSEFNYAKQLILFTCVYGNDEEIPALIASIRANYSKRSQKWFDNFLSWYTITKEKKKNGVTIDHLFISHKWIPVISRRIESLLDRSCT